MLGLTFLDTGLSIWTKTWSKDHVLLQIDYHSTWEEKSLHLTEHYTKVNQYLHAPATTHNMNKCKDLSS